MKRFITIGSWLSREDVRKIRRALVALRVESLPRSCAQSAGQLLARITAFDVQWLADILGAEVGNGRATVEPARPRGQPRLADRRVTVSVTDNQVAELDRLVDDDGARSRAAAVRLLIERHAAERAKDEES